MPAISGSILIVDDEENLRRTLTRILVASGWNVTGAANASEALNLVSANKFDLIYLDLRLPDMHGIEFLDELRKIDANLPVVVLTAYATMNSAVQSMHLGVTDYIIKPVDPETILARTRSILTKQFKDRRRKEIQDQIGLLQVELANLDQDTDLVKSEPEKTIDDHRILHKGIFTLDLHTRTASMTGKRIDLPPTTFEYLVVLTRHSPEVVRFQTLVTEAQGYHTGYDEARRLARWHIHVIRQALEDNPRKPRYILNVRGSGYQLILG